MNWYKTANDMTEYFRLNKRIHLFKNIIIQIKNMMENIPQNPPEVKKYLEHIANSKELSSFPDTRNLFLLAASKVLDNYIVTKELCDRIIERLHSHVVKIEKERKEIPNKIMEKLRRED